MAKELVFHNPCFEQMVRDKLLIKDRPITDVDALGAVSLDCSLFSFDAGDYATLSAFKNLEELSIVTYDDDLGFLKELPLLEELDLEILTPKDTLDFNNFSCLKNLRVLFVSGGDISDIQLKNLEALVTLEKLERLSLHEFGMVDLRPLRQMPWLKSLFCGYADKVYDIEAIRTLVNLEELILFDIEMENLDFLDVFPGDLELELCSIKVRAGIDHKKLTRFHKGNFDEIDGYLY